MRGSLILRSKPEKFWRYRCMKKESAQKTNALEIKLSDNTNDILGQVIEFLQMFLPATLVKRLVAILLLAIGIPFKNAVVLTSLCEKSMWTLKKDVRETYVRELMVIKSGNGRKAIRKTSLKSTN